MSGACSEECVLASISSMVPRMAESRAKLRLGPKTSDTPDLTVAQQALIADPAFWTAECDSGADYEIQSESLQELQLECSTSRLRRGIRHSVPVSWCHGFLAWEMLLPLYEYQSAALTRLQTAFAVPKDALTPDLFIKIAQDLDTVLFSGMLRGRTLISWEELPTHHGRLLRGSCGSGAQLRFKVEIRLGRACFFSDSKEVLWGTLVHEMLHAYLELNASRIEVACGGEYDELFVQSVDKLVERLALPGLGRNEIVGYL